MSVYENRNEYMREYYKRNAQKIRDRVKAYRHNNIDRVRQYDRQRGYREYDSVKAAARRAVNHAVARGTLTPGLCEVCGKNAEAHHDDYSAPLEVRWLCRPHHAQLHRKIA